MILIGDDAGGCIVSSMANKCAAKYPIVAEILIYPLLDLALSKNKLCIGEFNEGFF